MTEENWDVKVSFTVAVAASDADDAADKAVALVESGEFATGVEEGRFELHDISWKDAEMTG